MGIVAQIHRKADSHRWMDQCFLGYPSFGEVVCNTTRAVHWFDEHSKRSDWIACACYFVSLQDGAHGCEPAKRIQTTGFPPVVAHGEKEESREEPVHCLVFDFRLYIIIHVKKIEPKEKNCSSHKRIVRIRIQCNSSDTSAPSAFFFLELL